MHALRTSIMAVAACALTALAARGQAPAPDSTAHAALDEYTRSCHGVADRLWPRPVCGPLALIDPRTRRAFANTKTPDTGFVAESGVFTGQWPSSLGLANTAVDWHGERWAMVRLSLPDDAFNRIALLVHESFHRIQPSIGLESRDATSPHLEERDGRLWLRLELAALSQALTTTGADSKRHARDGMLFRRFRYTLYPGADTIERALEIAEGIAEYTGVRVALDATGLGPLSAVRSIDAHQNDPSYARSFAYATGPALGLLLDRLDPAWRTKVVTTRDVAGLLIAASGAAGALPDRAALIELARPYGYALLSRFEDDRATQRAARAATYRARLVEGPVLEFQQSGLARSFNPQTLFPLDSLGTVYPTGAFSAEWGTLSVDSVGVLVSPDYRRARVAVPAVSPADVKRLSGPGWTLELKDGWMLAPSARPGDLVVKRR